MGANGGIEENCETKCGQILNNSHVVECNIQNNNRKVLCIKKYLMDINQKKGNFYIWKLNIK